jgi:predicted nucleic acid-binding protein
MTQVFADTLYWVASITPGDPWYAPTLQAVAALGPVDLVTTEEVLVEFLSA